MTDPRVEDHLVGVELQLVELVECKERAVAQGREDDASVLNGEIEELQAELGDVTEDLESPVAPATVAAPSAQALPGSPARA
ncbi:MAG: hypothetical protein ACRD0Q_06115 [Acidimicrobiales bacterium]